MMKVRQAGILWILHILVALLALGEPQPLRADDIAVIDLQVPAGGSSPARVMLGTGHLGAGVAAPAALVALLQWQSPNPAAGSCPSATELGDLTRAPAPYTRYYQAQLQAAGEALDELELEQSLYRLSRARASMPCLERIVEPTSLRRLYVLEAVAHTYLETDREDAAWQQLFAVDPTLFLEPEFPPRIRDRTLAEAQRQLQVPVVTIDAPGQTARTFVNGRLVGPAFDLKPGVHLVQWEGPGSTVRGAGFVLPANQPSPVLLQELVEPGLPPEWTARELLTSALRSGRLDPGQQRALELWLQSERRSVALFLVDAPRAGAKAVRAYHAGRGIVPLGEALAALPGSDGPATNAPGSKPARWELEVQLGSSRVLAPLSVGQELAAGISLAMRLGAARVGLSVGGLQTGLPERVDGVERVVAPTSSGWLGWSVLRPGPVQLVPALGYGFSSSGLREVSDCLVGVVEGSGAAQWNCGTGSGSATALFQTWAHGPLGHIQVTWSPEMSGGVGGPGWALALELSAQAMLFRGAPVDSVIAPLRVEDRAWAGGARLAGSLSVMRLF